ncbi:hypothetical protein Vretimale_6012 [Volvox reticuliferus]|uniref:Membrane protein insertion efficiency factor n=1 Tax=Volvox reticuliferus TaxID=1737510 RepID=A0A8J4FHF8_9CHLO|nr:hypothetical protein Vretifemale_6158 [Volvox reticuliferus]GIM01183.1 hypothetical protein Vretimale_6012 [Volvox reticuliferus]
MFSAKVNVLVSCPSRRSCSLRGPLGASLCRNCWQSVFKIYRPGSATESLHMTHGAWPLLRPLQLGDDGGDDGGCGPIPALAEMGSQKRWPCWSRSGSGCVAASPCDLISVTDACEDVAVAMATAAIGPYTARMADVRIGGHSGWGQLSAARSRNSRSQLHTRRAGSGTAATSGDGRDSDPDSSLAPSTPGEAGVPEKEAKGEGQREESVQPGSEDADPPPSLGVRAALALLGFYRGVLSPLMPSTCRFLPTCSVYSIESYKKFGVARGTVLTAWRLLRCNPWGGRGYDPPAWPPVGLGAIYRYPYTPEISVVLGLAAAYWLVASTLESFSF